MCTIIHFTFNEPSFRGVGRADHGRVIFYTLNSGERDGEEEAHYNYNRPSDRYRVYIYHENYLRKGTFYRVLLYEIYERTCITEWSNAGRHGPRGIARH